MDEDLTGTVGGSAVDDRAGAVLPGVRVILEGTGLSAESDANGRFEIPGVLPGSYRVTAEYPGAARGQAEIRVVAYGNAELELRLERGSTALAACCRLHGRPVGHRGVPAPGVCCGLSVTKEAGWGSNPRPWAYVKGLVYR